MVLDVIIDKLTLCCSKKIVYFFLLTFFCLIRRQAWFGTVFFIVFVIYYVSLRISNISRLIEWEISSLNCVFIFLSTSYYGDQTIYTVKFRGIYTVGKHRNTVGCVGIIFRRPTLDKYRYFSTHFVVWKTMFCVIFYG